MDGAERRNLGSDFSGQPRRTALQRCRRANAQPSAVPAGHKEHSGQCPRWRARGTRKTRRWGGRSRAAVHDYSAACQRAAQMDCARHWNVGECLCPARLSQFAHPRRPARGRTRDKDSLYSLIDYLDPEATAAYISSFRKLTRKYFGSEFARRFSAFAATRPTTRVSFPGRQSCLQLSKAKRI